MSSEVTKRYHGFTTQNGTKLEPVLCVEGTRVHMVKPEDDNDRVEFQVAGPSGEIVIETGAWDGETKQNGIHTVTAFGESSFTVDVTYTPLVFSEEKFHEMQEKEAYSLFKQREAARAARDWDDAERSFIADLCLSEEQEKGIDLKDFNISEDDIRDRAFRLYSSRKAARATIDWTHASELVQKEFGGGPDGKLGLGNQDVER